MGLFRISEERPQGGGGGELAEELRGVRRRGVAARPARLAVDEGVERGKASCYQAVISRTLQQRNSTTELRVSTLDMKYTFTESGAPTCGGRQACCLLSEEGEGEIGHKSAKFPQTDVSQCKDALTID